MKIECDQETKLWVVYDDDGKKYSFTSLTDARDWMDNYENMKQS